MSISKSQIKYLEDLDALAGIELENFSAVSGALELAAKKFLENLEANAKEAKFAGSGNLISDATYELSSDGKSVNIILNNYYDFVNQGVKGWGSSANAPNSPYAYKNKPKSKTKSKKKTIKETEFRKSIREYVQSGRAKLTTVENDKAFGIGTESKGKSLIDTKIDTMMYLIRRFGIKATNYFTKTVNESRDDIELIIAEAVGKDIVLKFKVK